MKLKNEMKAHSNKISAWSREDLVGRKNLMKQAGPEEGAADVTGASCVPTLGLKSQSINCTLKWNLIMWTLLQVNSQTFDKLSSCIGVAIYIVREKQFRPS